MNYSKFESWTIIDHGLHQQNIELYNFITFVHKLRLLSIFKTILLLYIYI